MEKIIVTGGLGFIGSNLINILKKKYFIINIDKVSYASNFKNIDPNIKNYKFYGQNIKNKIFFKNILKKYNPSIIYNLAAETHVDRSIDEPKAHLGTSHGSAFNYDTHVPLLWYGANIPSQNCYRTIQIVDIAPTLIHLMNLQRTGAMTGLPILEILQK
jgi:dTDP-D-glucose 4,6-dehydratase